MDGGERLKGRVALVTGGASGLGRATAMALAAADAHVAVADINGPGSQDTLEQISGDGGSAEVLVAGMVVTLLLLDPSAFVPEMQIVPRLEPNFPR